jgi:hypothetical protein
MKKSRKVVTVTKAELFDIIKKIDGKQATFISLFARTVVSLNKKSADKSRTNDLGVVYKFQKLNGLINFNYVNSMHKRDENYVVGERVWGEKSFDMDNGTLVGYHEKSYITVSVEKHLCPSKYTSKGRFITWADLSDFYGKKTKSKAQELGMEYRNFKFDSIVKISFNGTTYKVRG